MDNFESLYRILKESGMNDIKITFKNLLTIFGKLPEESAYRNWWSNDGSHEFSKTWCKAGYNVTKVVPGVHVCFTRIDKIKAKSQNAKSQPIVNSDNAAFLKKVEKKPDNDSSQLFGWIILVIDCLICIPAGIACLKSGEIEGLIGLIICGFIFGILGLFLLASPSSSGGGHFHYTATYDDVLREMRSHNSRVEQMMRESEYRRVQEESQRISNEMHQDLADMFDGRLTNIFKNPWKGIL